jgi:ATP-binding cassette subfamily B protein
VTNVLADTIPGIRVVKAFAQEKREAARFREANRHNLGQRQVNKVWSLFSPTVTFLTEVGLLVVWVLRHLAGLRADHRRCADRLPRLHQPLLHRLDSMSRIVSVTQKAAAGAKRIFDILDHVSSVPEPAKPVHLEKVKAPSKCAKSASATATAP